MVVTVLALLWTTSAAPVIARDRVHLSIVCSGDGKLKELLVGTQPLIVSENGDFQAALRRAVPNKNAELIITNSVETPYRCLGGFIFSLQRAGYKRISFISEPPAEQ